MDRNTKLIISATIDLIGLASYAIPFWGEVFDFFFAWIEAAWIWYAYRSKRLAILGGLEEMIPILNVLPACTIAHFLSRDVEAEETPHYATDKSYAGQTVNATARTVSSSACNQ